MGYSKTEMNKWVLQEFTDHIKINYDGSVTTRVVYLHGKSGFTFAGKNPLKLPKKVQRWINGWMQTVCEIEGISVWDCEAWEGYENTFVVH